MVAELYGLWGEGGDNVRCRVATKTDTVRAARAVTGQRDGEKGNVDADCLHFHLVLFGGVPYSPLRELCWRVGRVAPTRLATQYTQCR